MPPFFWASAITCSVSVVFPEDSGPKISVTRPRGIPPIPIAMSRTMEPVDMAGTLTFAESSPSFMTAPLPNCFSICASAISSALSRSLLMSCLTFIVRRADPVRL